MRKICQNNPQKTFFSIKKRDCNSKNASNTGSEKKIVPSDIRKGVN
jgi:hypothetical protein